MPRKAQLWKRMTLLSERLKRWLGEGRVSAHSEPKQAVWEGNKRWKRAGWSPR